jgi:hypothetical protein
MRFFSVKEYAMSAPEKDHRKAKSRDRPCGAGPHGVSGNNQPVQESPGEERLLSLLEGFT